MQIIDSHVHIWTHQPEFPWSAEEQDIPTVNAHPDDLIEQFRENGIERAVLVQYIKYRWDNRYAAHVMKTCPSLFMGVCRVDPQNPGSPDHLSYWTEEHGFHGVRLSPELDARGDWFTGPLMVPLFKRAADLNVPVIILTLPGRLDDLAKIIERVPDVNIVIDHLADCLDQPGVNIQKLLNFARFPRVFLKLGHNAQGSSQDYPWCDTHSALEKVFQQFGANRIMWGSDWPFSLRQMTYAQSLGYIKNEVKFLTPEEREWVTSKTALQIWRFPGEIACDQDEQV